MRAQWTATKRLKGTLVVAVVLALGVWMHAHVLWQWMAVVPEASEKVQRTALLLISDPGHVVQFSLLWIQDQYQRAPTLVLGLLALLTFPVVAIVAAVVRAFGGGEHDNHRAAKDPYAETNMPSPVELRPDLVTRPKKAIVEVPDPFGRRRATRFQLSQPVVQIGRSEDVDIVINDPTVHRHHAAIHCNDAADYLVTDLSAGTGNGVRVNGEPVLQRKICNGDEIRLGRAKLKFLTSTA